MANPMMLTDMVKRVGLKGANSVEAKVFNHANTELGKLQGVLPSVETRHALSGIADKGIVRTSGKPEELGRNDLAPH